MESKLKGKLSIALSLIGATGCLVPNVMCFEKVTVVEELDAFDIAGVVFRLGVGHRGLHNLWVLSN